MSLYSVQHYTKDLLQNLQLPVSMGGLLGGDRLTAYVTPPVVDDTTTPRAYIWGSKGKEQRDTMPRGKAMKYVDYKIYVWVVAFADLSDFVGADSLFPSVLDEVMFALRTVAPMPVYALLDEKTGRTSDLMNFGEQLEWDYAPVEPVSDQSTVARFDGKIVIDVREILHNS